MLFRSSARLGGVVYSRTQAMLDYYGVSEASAEMCIRDSRYSDGWARDQRLYFRTRFSKPFAAMQLDTACLLYTSRCV